MKKTALFAAAAAVFVATPALAQEESSLHAYAGAIAGLDHVVASGGGGTKDGVVYGGVVGVDSTIGSNTILGVEAEIDGSTTSVSQTSLLVPNDFAKISIGRDLYIGVRAGVKVSPKLLAYVKGGYTNARLKATYRSGGTTTTDGQNFDGYRLGAGVETAVGRARLRLEYRFSNYNDLRINGVATGVSPQRHQIVAGVLFGF